MFVCDGYTEVVFFFLFFPPISMGDCDRKLYVALGGLDLPRLPQPRSTEGYTE